MTKSCDTLPLDSDISIEVDDGTFVRTQADKARVCGYLPLNDDIVIEDDL